MRKYAIGFVLGVALIACVAATISQQGIFFRGVYGGEPLIAGDSPNQSSPWIDFRSNGVAIFQLPANGILSTQNGGTGGTNFSSPSAGGLNFIGNTNSFFQLNLQNQSSGGSASGDIVVTADNGTANSFYGDFGINSSTFTNLLIPPMGTNTVFLLAVGNSTNGPVAGNTVNLFIGSAQTNSSINFSAGNGLTQTNVQINSAGTIVFGTFTNNGASYVPTNTAAFSTVTNDLVTGSFTLLRNQRGTLTVSLGGAANAGVIYSNGVSGIKRTFLIHPAPGTNTITIRFQPNSMIAVTNATVLANTSEINYE